VKITQSIPGPQSFKRHQVTEWSGRPVASF